MSDSNASALSGAKRALLRQRIRGEVVPTARQPLVARATGGPTPLSVAQEQLWYFSHLAPENPRSTSLPACGTGGCTTCPPGARTAHPVSRHHGTHRVDHR
jgi:hypothetical protein